MNIKTMTNLIKAWQIANEMDKILLSIGYDASPYFEICGHISDFIYDLLMEQTNTYPESSTYFILTDPSMTVEERANAILKRLPE